MLHSIKAHFNNHRSEVYSTIKLIDIEERFDLVFSRFFGLYFAKIGKFLNMTPTQISIVSLIIGVAGGCMLFYQDRWVITVWASILITLAGVLDSTDGQLARMTGQSTELGRFVDGFIDSAIFLTCYLAACAYYVQGDMGWSVFLLAIPAGMVSHIFTSQIYDFYKTEFLYYVAGSKSAKMKKVGECPQISDETGVWNKFFRMLEIDYTRRQRMLVTRTEEMRDTYEEVAFNSSTRGKFIEKYRATFNPIMFWWALVGGTNTHRILIMLFSIMGRFDLYLILCLIKLIPIAIVILIQKIMDEDFVKQMEVQFAAQDPA